MTVSFTDKGTDTMTVSFTDKRTDTTTRDLLLCDDIGYHHEWVPTSDGGVVVWTRGLCRRRHGPVRQTDRDKDRDEERYRK